MSGVSMTPLERAILTAPGLFGTMISCPLYGIAAAQAIYYYRTYPNDLRSIKILVGALLILDSAHTFCLFNSMVVWYLAGGLALTYPKSYLFSTILSYLTISVVQSAYSIRVWRISGKKQLITGVLLSCSILQFLSGTGVLIDMTIVADPRSAHTPLVEIFIPVQLASSMTGDILISISLVYFLNINRSGFRKSEKTINRLILYSINIGLVTSILAVANLVTWAAMPQSFVFTTINMVICKFYVNSFLASLNARTNLRKDFSGLDSNGDMVSGALDFIHD